MKTIVRGPVTAYGLTGVVFKNITFTHPREDNISADDEALQHRPALLLVGGQDITLSRPAYTIEHCLFQCTGAAGLQIFATSATVLDSEVTTSDSPKSSGGGLLVSCGGNYSFKRCRFVDNRSCGAYLTSCIATFTDCKFRGNSHHGLHVWNSAEVHLEGQSTQVLDNGRFGLCAEGSVFLGGNHPTDGDRWPGGAIYLHLPAGHPSIAQSRDRSCGNGVINDVEDDGLLWFDS